MAVAILSTRSVRAMAVAILSTRSAKAMAVENPSLRPYFLSDNNLNFSMYLCNVV